jgi:hypothetical protein
MRANRHSGQWGVLVAVLLLSLMLLPATAGLDLIPLGKAKTGHEAEWQRLMEIVYQGGRHSDEEIKRLEEISIKPTSGDGAARHTHSGMYPGVPATSFRGSFLTYCEGLIGRDLLEKAWTHVMAPEAAVTYGKQLLAIADAAERGERSQAFPQTKNVWRGSGMPVEVVAITVEEQVEILRSGGRWYMYWGERGHPIHAWW